MRFSELLQEARCARIWLSQVIAVFTSTFSSISVFALKRLPVVIVFSSLAGLQACVATMSSTSSSTTSTLPTEQASQAFAFTDSVGVVTHLSYTNTPYYTAFPQILSSLKTLGIHHIRDGYYPWLSSSPIVQAHRSLAAAGIRCNYVIPYAHSTQPIAIEDFAPEVGDLEALEAPNECDVSGECGGNGAAAVSNVVAFLPTVHLAAADLNVPAVGPSFVVPASYLLTGNLDSLINFNNLHIYFGGRNPGSAGWGDVDAEGNSYGSFSWWLDQAAIDGPGLPSEITETGYIASPTTTTPYTLPEGVEASYTPRTLLLAYNHGFKRTLLYELLDEVSSPGYGLLHSDLTPKPAFKAVSNLLATLDDSNAPFTAGSLPYLISGADSTLNHVLLEKHDGSFWLVLWLEQSSWNPESAKPISVSAQNIGLQLSSDYMATTDYQFDATGSVSAFNQPMNGNWAGLTATDKISIVRIVHR